MEIYNEATYDTPLFFVLFPGAAPFGYVSDALVGIFLMACSDVQKLAAKLDHSVEAGNLVHLSMGQGQEKIAEGTLDKYVPVACLWPF